MLVDGRIQKRILRALLFLGAIAMASAGEAGSWSDFPHATTIELNTTVRMFDNRGNEPHCFRVFIPPGTLMVDVSVSGGVEVAPRLTFHDHTGVTIEEGGLDLSFLKRTAAGVLLTVRAAGMYSFCVAAQDPLLQLAEYKLSNAYAGTFDEKNGDSDEDEPDPDSFAFGCGLKNGDPDEDEPDPDSFAFDYGDLDEFELDPDSFANDCDPSLRRVIDQMCRSGEVDDHGDTFACATTLDLGHPVFGEVRNDWGDDADIFAFMLSELRTVEIATSGRIDIFGGLYDRSGQRLAADDDGGSGDRFRLVKTLVPGWYFVRVEGRHSSEGDYRLHVDVLSQ